MPDLTKGAARALTFCALLAVGTAGAAAGTLSDYRLLVLGGGTVKWGAPTLGEGARVTYAVASRAFRFEGARNCGEIAPLDALLAKNDVDETVFENELDLAFRAWSAVANVHFQRVAETEADILIGAQAIPRGRAFTNVVHEPPAQGTTAGRILGSVICLNPEEGWKIGFDGDLEVYDLRYTMMHEIGHAIGLDHPESVDAVMDFRYTEAFASLRQGDREGAANLYGPSLVGAVDIPVPADELDVDAAAVRVVDERAFGE